MKKESKLPEGFVMEAKDAPTLPEGFVREDTGGLPPGFVMEGAAPASEPVEEKPSLLSRLNPLKGFGDMVSMNPIQNYLTMGVKAAQGVQEVGEQVAPIGANLGKAIGDTIETTPGSLRNIAGSVIRQHERNAENMDIRVKGVEAPWQRAPAEGSVPARLLENANKPITEWENEISRKFEAGEELSSGELVTALAQKTGKTITEATEVPESLRGDGYWKEVIAPGLGTFLGMGAVRAVGGLPSLALSVVGPSRKDFAEDAMKFTEDPETLRTSEEISQVIGASQLIPIELFWTIGKAQKLAGGSELLKTFKQAVATGGAESALEAFYEAAKNFTASDSGLAYDPDRSLTENVGEAATAGGVVGFLGSVMMRALGLPTAPLRNKGNLKEAIEDILEREPPAPPEQVGPTREDLANILETALGDGRSVHDILASLERAANVQGPPSPLHARVPFGAEQDRVGTGSSTADGQMTQAVLERLKKDGLVPPWPGQVTIMPDQRHYTDLKNAEKVLSDYNEMWSKATVEQQQKLYPEMQQITEQVNMLKQRVADQNTLRTNLQGVLQEWVKTYNPDGKYILTFNQLLSDKGWLTHSPNQQGSMIALSDGSTIIDVDLGNLKNLSQGENLQTHRTLSHEFGHSLAKNLFRRQPEFVQRAIVGMYQRYLRSQESSKTMREWLGKKYGPGFNSWQRRANPQITPEQWGVHFDRPPQEMLANREKADKKSGVNAAEGTLAYELSFDEWFANQTAQSLLSRPEAGDVVGRFFKRAGEVLRRFWQREHTKWDNGEQTFNDFLDLLRKQATDRHLAARLTDLYGTNLNAQSKTDAMTDTAFIDHVVKSVTDSPKLGGPLASKGVAKKIRHGVDHFHKLAKWGYTIVQVAKMNPHIAGLQEYLGVVQKWWNEGNYWREAADGIYKDWERLGKVMAERLGEFAIDVTIKSEELGRRLSNDELTAMSQEGKYKLSVEAMQLYYSMDNLFREAVGYGYDTPRGLYQVRLEEIRRLYREDESARVRETARLDQEMKKLLDTNYFPLMRFGEHTITVRALEEFREGDKDYYIDDVVRFEAFETKADANARAEQLRRQYKDKQVAVGQGVMTDFQQSVQGLPRQFLEMLQTSLGLSDDQKAQLRDLINDASPTNSYKKHMKHRKIVNGFDLDGPRAFATYFSSYSNYISKLRHAPAMQDAIKNVEKSANDIRRGGGDGTKRDQIAAYLREHNQYIMNPGNELAWLRGAGFVWYLGYNVKSAFVNLTQVPMVLYPYLSARKELKGGDKGATEAILRAYKKASMSYAKEGVLNEGEALMIQELIRRGIIDQSLAMELSAAREGGNLVRTLPGTFKSQPVMRGVRNFSYGAAWMFHMAEKMNRRVSALAGYDMARKAGMDHYKAVEEAYLAVRDSQFEYASYNRPKFMRGKASTLFLFFMYMQNALWFGTHDPGAKRFWLVMLATAGISGLPFAEDAMDLFDYLATKWKTAMGHDNPRVRVREDIRGMLTAIGADPHLMMHGLSGTYGAGPLHLLSMAGAPIPNFDISASTSLGRVIPGFELLTGQGQAENTLARAGEDVAGAAWGMPLGIYKALKSDDMDQWKRFESALPVFMGNISRGARRTLRGYEQDTAGNPILEFDVSDPMHQAEIAGRLTGFESSRVTIERDRRWAQNEYVRFWETRRGMLLGQYWHAMKTGDKEGLADVRKAIRKYNSTIPEPAFILTPQMLRQSLMERSKRRALTGQGLPRNPRHSQSYEKMRELYPHQDEKAP